MTTGVEIIAEERRQQIVKHHITPDVDAQFNSQRTEMSGLYPLIVGALGLLDPDYRWVPAHWNRDKLEHMREKQGVERLAIAGALIAAEIDRIRYVEFGAEPAGETPPITERENRRALEFALWIGKNGYNMISENLWVRETDPIQNEYTTEELFTKFLNYITGNE
jgi:hypothetical protein